MSKEKLLRNLETEEDRKFWEEVLRSAKGLEGLPVWYRAGITVTKERSHDY